MEERRADWDVLRAGRLILEPMTERQVPALWGTYQRSVDRLRPYLAWVETTKGLPDFEHFATNMRMARHDGTNFVYVVFAPDGSALGSVGLHNVDRRHLGAEMGFWMDVARQRRGITTAAAARLTRYAFTRLGLHRLYIRHALDNVASRRVIEKLGFTHEGTLREEKRIDGRWVSHEAYGMLAPEYEARRDALLALEEGARL